MDLKGRIALVQDSVITHRRWLHAHPELSGQEKETAAYIAAALPDIWWICFMPDAFRDCGMYNALI